MKPRPTLGEHLKNAARMRRPDSPCLDEQQAVAFYSGSLSQEEVEGVRNHLADCAACLDLAREARQFVEAMSGPVDAPPNQTAVEGASRAPVRSQPLTRRSLWQTLRAYLRVSPALAFSVAAAVVVLAGSALLIAEVFRLQNQLQNMQAAQGEKDRQLQELNQELAQERARVEQLTAELQGHTGTPPQPDREPARVVDQRPSDKTGREPQRDRTGIAAFVLTPSLVRDVTRNKPFELSATTTQVELHVSLGPDYYKSYRALLKTYDGEQKLSKSGLKAQSTASGKRLVVIIPASLLDKRDYVLRLIGVGRKGDQEELDQYPFSVVKK